MQKISPFLETKYGWNFGESGWNLGMDENLLKFSFLLNATIDDIVDTLPTPVSGRAYFLTTDNRLYYVVGTEWMWSPVPEGYEVTIKGTGLRYRYQGGSLEEVIDTENLQKQALASLSRFAEELASAGFENLGSYGIVTFTSIKQYVTTDYSYYSVKDTTPLPYTTTGDWVTDSSDLQLIGDDLLRKELSGKGGASLVGFSPNPLQTPATVEAELVRIASLSGVPVERYLPEGYMTDGSVDYGVYVQTAIDENEVVVMPAFPVLVSAPGLDIPSNRTIIWPTGAETRLAPNSLDNYEILDMRGVRNISLISPKLVGDLDGHTGTTGEFGMGIGMRSCSDITIYNADISKCWGDGVYIGRLNGYEPPMDAAAWNNNNIRFTGTTRIHACRRQGMSIITVNGLHIDFADIDGINGTPPEDGIDFEPNYPYETFKNVTIDRVVTNNCVGYGVQFSLRELNSTSQPLSVTIRSHEARNCEGGLSVSTSGTALEIGGYIRMVAPDYSDLVRSGILVRRWGKASPHLLIERPRITDPNKFGGTFASDGSHISMYNIAGEDAGLNFGNITIESPELIRTAGDVSPVASDIYLSSASNTISNVRITDIKDLRANSIAYGGASKLDQTSEVTGFSDPVSPSTLTSTTNGFCIRHEDGTQECWVGGKMAAVNVAAGTLFTNPTVDWIFPLPFIAPPPFVSSGLGTGGNTSASVWPGRPSLITATAARPRVLSTTSIADTVEITGYARGHWK